MVPAGAGRILQGSALLLRGDRGAGRNAATRDLPAIGGAFTPPIAPSLNVALAGRGKIVTTTTRDRERQQDDGQRSAHRPPVRANVARERREVFKNRHFVGSED